MEIPRRVWLQFLLDDDLANGEPRVEVLEASVHELTGIRPDGEVARSKVPCVSTPIRVALKICSGTLEPRQIIAEKFNAEIAICTQDAAYVPSGIEVHMPLLLRIRFLAARTSTPLSLEDLLIGDAKNPVVFPQALIVAQLPVALDLSCNF